MNKGQGEAYVDGQPALQLAGWSGGGALDPSDPLEAVHMAVRKSKRRARG